MEKGGELSMDDNNGEPLETPAASPAETITTEPTETVNSQGAVVNGNPEEVEFNSLKGGTQDRIKTILKERDQYKALAAQYQTYYTASPQTGYAPQPQTVDLSNPQVREAVSQLSKVGIATDEKVDQKISQSIGNLVYNFELQSLEDKLDGANGLPKFDRNEYFDYVNRNPKYQNYAPEDVYNIMYSEEIMDAKLKERGNSLGQSSNSSLRPTKTTVREEQWTPEALEQRLREPDGKNWYAKNIELVNKVLSSQLPQE